MTVDVLQELQELVLDDLPPVAYTDVSFRFSNSHAEKPYPYVDHAVHEWTGLDPIEITCELHFANNLQPGSFPDGWNKWWAALQDGEAHNLQHPVLGEYLVVVRGGEVKVAAGYRGGIVATVTFRTTILDPADAANIAPLTVTIEEAAAKADAACANLGVTFPDGFVALSLQEFLNALGSTAFIIEAEAIGLIRQAQGIIASMDRVVTQFDNFGHAATEAHTALVSLWTTLENVAERTGLKQRKTSSLKLQEATTLTQFASDRGNTLSEIMGLNPEAIFAPMVPKGAVLKFYV